MISTEEYWQCEGFDVLRLVGCKLGSREWVENVSAACLPLLPVQ
jgi:hypothetical protein